MDRTDVLHTAVADSFWGRVALAWTERGVAGLGWARDVDAVAEEAAARTGAGRVVRVAEGEWEHEVAPRFPGLPAALREGQSFLGPYDLPGTTPFFDRVWRACRTIPKGEVRTYGWLAAQAGNPRAARAAGMAMRANPVPLLTPCHRVLPSTMRVGNYGMGGPSVKERLLRMEGYRA